LLLSFFTSLKSFIPLDLYQMAQEPVRVLVTGAAGTLSNP
jgi:hypothetical protein